MIPQSSKLSLLLLAAALTTASFVLLSPAAAQAQGGVPLWTNRYAGPWAGWAHPAHIAVDSSGNVFLAVGLLSRRDLTGEDCATLGYSSAGVPLWTNIYNGPGNDEDTPYAIAVDSSGNVFVTGSSINGNNVDYVTLAYSNAGVPLWTNYYNGYANGGNARAIAVDSSGNVFVTGQLNSRSNPDYATVAYSNSGVPLWTNRYNGPANDLDVATAIAVDSRGNVFVTGESGNDYATVAYSNAGVPLWTNRYDGPANERDAASAIAVDSSGNVFVTGFSVPANGWGDYATINYSSAGVPLWTNRYNGLGNDVDGPTAIAVDSIGNVFVTGYSEGRDYQDYATIAYSSSGVPLWTNRYNGPADNYALASAIAVDSSGNVFVTGLSSDGSNQDYVTIKYSSSVPPVVHLDFQLLDNQLRLSWTNAGFNLQSAPAIPGTFTNIPSATSPFTNPITAPQQFFRLKGD